MFQPYKTAFVSAVLLAFGTAHAANFEPKFSDYGFPGTQYTVDAAANAYFSLNYGITIDNAYLYRDSRDTFDGIGVSTGTVAELGSLQTAIISFLDSTPYVYVDYWSIQATTYKIVDSSDNELDSFSVGANQEGTHLFSASGIAALKWTSNGGYGQVSGLRYDYDGKTDGHNDSGGNRVPDGSSTGILLAIGFVAVGAARLRRS